MMKENAEVNHAKYSSNTLVEGMAGDNMLGGKTLLWWWMVRCSWYSGGG